EGYEATIRMSEEVKHLSGISTGWGGLAWVLQEEGNSKAAIEGFRKALKAAEQARDFRALATHNSNLGRLLEKQGDYAVALRAYERSLELYQRMNNQGESALARFRYGSFLWELTEDPRAISYLRRAEEVARGTQDDSLLNYTQLALARTDDDQAER